eukprot:2586850-Heterocapsa_arctica.AAC.1
MSSLATWRPSAWHSSPPSLEVFKPVGNDVLVASVFGDLFYIFAATFLLLTFPNIFGAILVPAPVGRGSRDLFYLFAA